MSTAERAHPTPRGRLLTLAEVCDELRISIHTGRKLVRAGRLGCLQNGGVRRFTKDHIEEFLAGGRTRGSEVETP